MAKLDPVNPTNNEHKYMSIYIHVMYAFSHKQVIGVAQVINKKDGGVFNKQDEEVMYYDQVSIMVSISTTKYL